jgi:hypothetical protein
MTLKIHSNQEEEWKKKRIKHRSDNTE